MASYNTVVVTGANRGLGLEWVNQLGGNSERIIATCRDPDSADELMALAEQYPVEIHTMDVTSEDDIEALVDLLGDDPVDLLINNSGVMGPADSGGFSDLDGWRDTFEVNTLAPIHLSQRLASHVAESTRKLIANITSKMGSIGDNGSGGRIIYRSSKAALNAATRSFALDHAEQGIVTLLLHPGWVQTDMGGPNGLIDTETSVRGMAGVLDRADASLNGGFFNYDGSPIPW